MVLQGDTDFDALSQCFWLLLSNCNDSKLRQLCTGTRDKEKITQNIYIYVYVYIYIYIV